MIVLMIVLMIARMIARGNRRDFHRFRFHQGSMRMSRFSHPTLRRMAGASACAAATVTACEFTVYTAAKVARS